MGGREHARWAVPPTLNDETRCRCATSSCLFPATDLCSKDTRALRLTCKRLFELGDAAVSQMNTRVGASAEELCGALSHWCGLEQLVLRLLDPNAAELLLELSCWAASCARRRPRLHQCRRQCQCHPPRARSRSHRRARPPRPRRPEALRPVRPSPPLPPRARDAGTRRPRSGATARFARRRQRGTARAGEACRACASTPRRPRG
jgi:hypothetical protein